MFDEVTDEMIETMKVICDAGYNSVKRHYIGTENKIRDKLDFWKIDFLLTSNGKGVFHIAYLFLLICECPRKTISPASQYSDKNKTEILLEAVGLSNEWLLIRCTCYTEHSTGKLVVIYIAISTK